MYLLFNSSIYLLRSEKRTRQVTDVCVNEDKKVVGEIVVLLCVSMVEGGEWSTEENGVFSINVRTENNGGQKWIVRRELRRESGMWRTVKQ